MKKNNNKGFTLVELIVVLVILAILAAILVPALLGYIDKAREKQVTTNAEAAYVAAQALATEYYGKTPKASVTAANAKTYVLGTDNGETNIKTLTDIQEAFTVDITMKDETTLSSKDNCIINTLIYKQTNGKQAIWTRAAGYTITVTDGSKTSTYTSTAGGWFVGDTVSFTAP